MRPLTTDDAAAMEREMCSRSLAYFVQRAWPHIIPDTLQWNWHLDAVSDHLEAVARGDIKRLLINVPPGTSKSTMTGVMFPAWLWGPGKKPGFRYIGAAHEQGLAVRDNRMMRALITSEWYQRLWPLVLQGDQNEKLYFENEARGFRQACAVESMTGRRGNAVVWDDPLSPEKANSPTARETAIRILSETVTTRLNDPINSAIVVVMQRLHEADPSGHIIANDLGYDHLCIPMEYEGARPATSIDWTDPRSEPGELLDPVRFPAHVIERDKRAMGSYAWAGQMQQRPSPAGGGIFKDEWWQIVQASPRLKWRAVYADTAMKTGQENDYSVFQCWGRTDAGQAILLDMIRGKWEAPDLLVRAKAFWEKHKAPIGPASLRKMAVEDKASGTGLIQDLRRQGVPIVPIQRDKDKVTRAMDAAPLAESRNVLILQDCPHLSDFLAEASAFPNGAHDDTVDPMMDAIGDILRGGSFSLSDMVAGF